MPPQQRERLLDFGDEVLGFRAHEFIQGRGRGRFDSIVGDLTSQEGQRN
jgi:hypothetical protein